MLAGVIGDKPPSTGRCWMESSNRSAASVAYSEKLEYGYRRRKIKTEKLLTHKDSEANSSSLMITGPLKSEIEHYSCKVVWWL